jgi:uncharacterized membrane protein
MSLTKTVLIVVLIIFISSLASILALPRLPDLVVSHWGANGQPNGYMPRLLFVGFMPLILIVTCAMMLFLPQVDPLKKNFEAMRSMYYWFVMGFCLVMAYIHGLSLAYNLGFSFNFTTLMMPAFAVLMGLTGFLVEGAKPNWFIGIRTPWTMSNPVVWEKTHRLGGVLFKGLAVIILLGIFLPAGVSTVVLLVSLTVVVVVLMVYSYLVYQQEQNKV